MMTRAEVESFYFFSTKQDVVTACYSEIYFINIYNKFDVLDKKLNDYHIKTDKINEIIDLIISDEYTKIYKTYHPMKNYDLMQDTFFYI